MIDLDAIEQGLRQEGWARADGLVPPELLLALAQEARAHRDAGRLQPAATGRGGGRARAGLRGDATLWLDDPCCGEAAAQLLALFDQLREVGSSRVDLQACKLEYSIVSPK